jgi:hypothetical protein
MACIRALAMTVVVAGMGCTRRDGLRPDGAGSGGGGGGRNDGAAGHDSAAGGTGGDAAANLDAELRDAADAVDPGVLVPTPDGRFDGANPWGIRGAWSVFADSFGRGVGDGGHPAGDCQAAGFSDGQCSMVTAPAPGAAFPSTNGKMCVVGTAAQVLPLSSAFLGYADMWGVSIGFDLDDETVDGSSGPQPYDASAHGILGFSFEVDTPPTNAVRVELITATQRQGASSCGSTDSGGCAAWWGGATANASPVKPGRNMFRWPDIGGPIYLANPPPFDRTQVIAMRFHVTTNSTSAIPFQFCISNIQPITR